MDFPGCLLVVSHDRYFMDKITDHLFVFKGNAEINDFPGNYSDFRAYDQSSIKEPAATEVKTEKKSWKKDQKSGLSFNEQKEYNKLEREIKNLETQKATLEKLFASGNLSGDEINTKSKELQQILDDIDTKTELWFELSLKMEA